MKSSTLFIGIALTALVNICNASNVTDKQNNSYYEVILAIDRDSTVFEVIESVNTNKIEKTIDELIAEDNAITENNISNETQVLDFNIINSNSIVDEVIESVNAGKIEKTTDELIAEDNAITENNISNETQPLNFEIINKNSKLLKGKNKSFLVIN